MLTHMHSHPHMLVHTWTCACIYSSCIHKQNASCLTHELMLAGAPAKTDVGACSPTSVLRFGYLHSPKAWVLGAWSQPVMWLGGDRTLRKWKPVEGRKVSGVLSWMGIPTLPPRLSQASPVTRSHCNALYHRPEEVGEWLWTKVAQTPSQNKSSCLYSWCSGVRHSGR